MIVGGKRQQHQRIQCLYSVTATVTEQIQRVGKRIQRELLLDQSSQTVDPMGQVRITTGDRHFFSCILFSGKTYFIKMSELRDKFTADRRAGKEASILNGLVRPSCLIIDRIVTREYRKISTFQ